MLHFLAGISRREFFPPGFLSGGAAEWGEYIRAFPAQDVQGVRGG